MTGVPGYNNKMSEPDGQTPDRTDPRVLRVRAPPDARPPGAAVRASVDRLVAPIGSPARCSCAPPRPASLRRCCRPPLHVACWWWPGFAVLALLLNGCAASAAPGRGRRPDRRLESRVRPAPPTTVGADRPGRRPPPGADALWKAHVAAAAAQIGRPCASACRIPAWPRATTRALRGALAVALVASLVIAGPEGAVAARRAIRADRGAPAAAPRRSCRPG